MPEYLPLAAFRQGLLPSECRSCAWWQTSGASAPEEDAASVRRHEWMTDLEQDWGHPGLLVLGGDGGRNISGSGEVPVSAVVHFAPASSLARFRELPFAPLPAFSALLFCFRREEDTPRWAAKRLLGKAVSELRSRGVEEVYAVAHWPENVDGAHAHPDCRFFSTEFLAANGFERVAHDRHLCLMRLDTRGLVGLVDQLEAVVRRLFSREEEAAPSPAAWVQGTSGADHSTR
jgi:hypothetical protein